MSAPLKNKLPKTAFEITLYLEHYSSALVYSSPVVGKIPPDLGSRGQHHVSSSCNVISVVISRVDIPVLVQYVLAFGVLVVRIARSIYIILLCYVMFMKDKNQEMRSFQKSLSLAHNYNTSSKSIWL